MRAKIVGTGSYLPKRVVTNDELSKRVDTSDEWITQMVGISSRHIAEAQETNVHMVTEAAKRALEAAHIEPNQLDLIIVATSTPDDMMPSTATQVQSALDMQGCPAFDISAACAGFVYALTVADQFFRAGTVRHVLVAGSDLMSRVVNWEDRRTCVLFADGAGAVILARSEHDEEGILSSHIHANGIGRDLLYVPNYFTERYDAASEHDPSPVPSYVHMEGGKVFKHAVAMLDEVVQEVLHHHHLTVDAIDWLIPHQANERIITAAANKLNIPLERVIVTLDSQGNTSAATVPLALDTAVRDGRIKKGDLLLLEAFGAGFTWGAVLIRY